MKNVFIELTEMLVLYYVILHAILKVTIGKLFYVIELAQYKECTLNDVNRNIPLIFICAHSLSGLHALQYCGSNLYFVMHLFIQC